MVKIKLEYARATLGDDHFLKLIQIETVVMLDHSHFGFFERCRLINEILSEHNYFLKFYERRNKFRYQLRQKLKTKNEVKRELSACAIQIFNECELLKNHLNIGERQVYVPIGIVYKLTLDVKKPILCFYAPSIHLGYHTNFEKTRGGKKYSAHTAARQCHYCKDYFMKSAALVLLCWKGRFYLLF